MFLGIDQSLSGTGLCLLTPDAQVKTLLTVAPGKTREGPRLALIKNRVSFFLNLGVTSACMEGYAYNAIGRVFELGEVGGVVKLAATEAHVALSVVPPTLLKKFATGNASADKDEVMAAAEALMGAPPGDDNQADAYFLALIALSLHTGKYAKTRAQLEVLKTLQQPVEKKRRSRIRKLVKNTI